MRRYRNFNITYSPKPGPIDCDWEYAHDSYDGAVDSNDHRCGYGPTLEYVKSEIDDMIAEDFDEKGGTGAIGSVVMGGVDLDDSPRFCDAFIEYAEWENGEVPLDDEELEEANKDSEFVNREAMESTLIW